MEAMTAAPIVRTNQRIRLPSGVVLATDLYRPAAAGKVPVVLVRTPYGRARHLAEALGWVERGVAFVAQDVRGRYDSCGEWQPYVHEREDGAATVAWLAGQSWCGAIVPAGGSYAAFTAWAAALGGHPAVRAAISLVPAMGPHAQAGVRFDRSGILHLRDHVLWWMSNGDTRVHEPEVAYAMLAACPDLLLRLPVVEIARDLWAETPRWVEAVLAGPEPPAWAIGDEEIAALAVPVLHIGGWHDPYIEQTLHHWQIAGSALARRPEQGLIVGPWRHRIEHHLPATFGERQYGERSRLPLGALQVRWLRRVLAGQPPAGEEAAARVFVAGANRWLAGAVWPPATTIRCWFAAAGGRLVEDRPEGNGADRFVYDPADPFPSLSEAVDRSKLCARGDAVRYTSPPLARPLTIAGAPSVTLFAATDGETTDWVARLLQVLPDGRVWYVTHAIVEAAREAERRGDALAPSVAAQFELRLSPVALTIPAGHHLCLEVTSSDFPEHARSLNHAGDRSTSAGYRVARQTVFRGRATPTAVRLPLIPTPETATDDASA
jgi:uncharacterized protein